MYVQSLSCVRVFAILWAVACQAALSMEFPRQEYCSGLPFPSPGDLLDSGMEPTSPALAGGFFAPSSMWEVQILIQETRKTYGKDSTKMIQ